MHNAVTKLRNFSKIQTQGINNLCIGQIVELTPEGRALVNYQSNHEGPIEARSIVSELPDNINEYIKRLPVLLVFENGDPKLPIIVGFVSETLFPLSNRQEITLPIERPGDAKIDSKKIVFDAEKEIVLRCGKSSVILNKSGKVVIKGTEITSRAVRTNKIKGATVNIN